MKVILISILVFTGRMLVPGHDLSWAGTYEAFAHIWVGYLIAMAIYSPNRHRTLTSLERLEVGEKRELAIMMLVILTAWETYMFLVK
jgi:hypothetical protein